MHTTKILVATALLYVSIVTGAQAFSSSELDAITEHLYRGGASPALTGAQCGSQCATFWTREQSFSSQGQSTDAKEAVIRELMEIRQRVGLLPPRNRIIGAVSGSKTTMSWIVGAGARAKWIGVDSPPPSSGRGGAVATANQLWGKQAMSSGGGFVNRAPSLGFFAKDSNGNSIGYGIQDEDPGNFLALPFCQKTTTDDSSDYPGWTVIRSPKRYTYAPCPGDSIEHTDDIFFPWYGVTSDTGAVGSVEDYDSQTSTESDIGEWDGTPTTWQNLRQLVENEIEGKSSEYPALRHWYEFGAADDVPALAQRFRPILKFDTGEPWRPLNVDRFFSENFFDDQDFSYYHAICPTLTSDTANCDLIAGDDDADPPAWTKLRDYRGGVGADQSDWPVIDIHNYSGASDDPSAYKSPRLSHCDHLPGTSDCEAGDNSALYYHSSGPFSEANYRFLDYWAFYRFDEFAPESHEADWEHVVVAVDASGDPNTFDWVGMSAHTGVYRYLRDALRCDDLGDGSCGGTGESPDPDGQRVETYVANGGHGNYSQPCSAPGGAATCDRPDGPPAGFEKGHDGARRWGANDDPWTLVRMPDDPPAWTSDISQPASWVNWPGYWGRIGSESKVISPGAPVGRDDFYQPWTTTCTELGSSDDCPSSLKRGAHQAKAGSQQDPCGPWNGPGIALSVCDPSILKHAMATGALGRRVDPISVRAPSRVLKGGKTEGLTQIPGEPLRPGGKLSLPAVPVGSTLRLSVAGRGKARKIAIFPRTTRRLGRGTVRIDPDGRPKLQSGSKTVRPRVLSALP